MALIVKDRVKEVTSTSGTGEFLLGGADGSYDTFASHLADGDTTYYSIVHSNSSIDEWEVGIGTYSTANNSIVRTTILSSSNSGSVVGFSSGVKNIFMTLPATLVNDITATSGALTSINTVSTNIAAVQDAATDLEDINSALIQIATDYADSNDRYIAAHGI
jgi:hypothetical protein